VTSFKKSGFLFSATASRLLAHVGCMISLCEIEDHSRDSLNYFAEDNMIVSEK
jgi:hypothetical protein